MKTDFFYSDTNQNHDIILHDCFADHIILQKNTLIFQFSEGFSLKASHPQNPFSAPAYTGEAEMRMELFYANPDVNVTIYLIKEEYDGTHRMEISLDEFLKRIEQNEKLEFLYTYQGIDTDDILFRCELHFDKHPYRMECILIISAKETSYHWNEIFQED